MACSLFKSIWCEVECARYFVFSCSESSILVLDAFVELGQSGERQRKEGICDPPSLPFQTECKLLLLRKKSMFQPCSAAEASNLGEALVPEIISTVLERSSC